MNIQVFNSFNNIVNNNYNKIQKKTAVSTPEIQTSNAPSFKGKENKFWEVVGKGFSKMYGEKVLNSKKLQDISEKLAKMNIGDPSTHMIVAGSTITSGVYVWKTYKNEKIDKENKPALMANQTACWAIPTAGAYYFDKKYKDKIKLKEYRYAGLNDQMHALGNMSQKELIKAEEKLAKRKGAFRTMGMIAMTTTLYRFITPVFVTPFTNKIGNYYNESKKKKAQEIAAQQQNTQAKTLNTAA